MTSVEKLRRQRALRLGASAAAAVALVTTVAACGGSSSDTSSKKAAATTSTATSAPAGPAGPTMAYPTGAIPINKSFAAGVPTLAELYKGTGSTPPTSGPPIAKGKSIVIVSCGQTVASCSIATNAAVEAAKAVGWKVRIIDAQLDANNGYVTAMQTAVATHPDAIATIGGIDCSQIKQPLAAAKAAGIPVLGVVANDCDDPQEPGGPTAPLFASKLLYNETADSAGTLYGQIGEQQAAAAINGTNGKARVIRVQFTTAAVGKYETQGQNKVFAKCPDCKIVETIGFTSTDLAPGGPLPQKFATALAKHPDANAVIYGFDIISAGIGLAKKLVDSGRAGKVLGISSEGFFPSLDLLRDQKGVDVAPSYNGEYIGYATIDTLNRLFNHQPAVPEGVGVAVVDAQHNLPPKGKNYTPAVDFRPLYRKLWGLAG